MGKVIRKSSIGTRLGKSSELGMCVCQTSKRTIPISVCGRYKTCWQETKHQSDLEMLMKGVDVGEPTSFLDHVYVGCTQRECQISKDIVDNYKSLFESRMSAGAEENFQKRKPHGNLMQKLSIHGPMTWNVTQRNAWKYIANWANKTTNNYTKSRHHIWMTTNLKDEEIGSVGDLSSVCSQIVLKCLSLARIGRPGILWSVNKLARAVKKWTKACDKRLARLISSVHHTCEYRQYCFFVGNTAQQCRLGLFQDSDFAGDLEDSKSTSGAILCMFGSRTFVPVSWMCKKQTSVPHSSTESEVISLDAGLRMDVLLALDLWDIVIEVLHSTKDNIQPKHTSHQETGAVLDSKTRTQHITRKQKVDRLSEVDHVPTNTHSSQGSDMTRSCQYFLCARNKPQFHTVLWNLK